MVEAEGWGPREALNIPADTGPDPVSANEDTAGLQKGSCGLQLKEGFVRLVGERAGIC